ncbi:helix-turn-helix transcriptional regulator [Amycolatopsis sp. 195334CR]|uniref:helix-turn-helix domain-containing protein n=1 Tax=Amycolatopsis sp. 195334CR TaxID=2814588 RepID=UPI001A8FD128|nr:helix-turn-helix transcriptional regulator [Amycolatopsis sp. 195334CR]MBN6034178.1 helix-turn-helix domain-containing protein [Amycolatopsis sp. 195334CR]
MVSSVTTHTCDREPELSGSAGEPHQPDPRRYSERLGDELRQYRQHKGFTSEAAADHMSWSHGMLSDAESGTRRVRRAELDALIDVYEIGSSDAKRLRDLRARASKEGPAVAVPTRYRQFHPLQATAVVQRTYASSLLPSICRIEEYASALAESAPLTNREIAADSAHYEVRQALWLLNRDQPPEVHLVLGEAALYNLAGSRRTQLAQLDHLAKLARLPHFHLQILPFDETGHAAADTGWTLLTQPHAGTWLCVDNLLTTTCTDDPDVTRAHQDAFNMLSTRALGQQDSIDRLLGVRRAHATSVQRRIGIDTAACRRLHNQFNLTLAQLSTVFDCSTETISQHLRRYDPRDALAEPVPGNPAEPWRPPTPRTPVRPAE